jgi:hypothetical protein
MLGKDLPNLQEQNTDANQQIITIPKDLLGNFFELLKGKKPSGMEQSKDDVIDINHPSKNNSKPPKGGRNTFNVLKKTINTCF